MRRLIKEIANGFVMTSTAPKSSGALNYGKYSDAEALNRLSAFRAAVGQWRTEPARQLYEYLAGQPPFAVICFKNWSVLTQWSRIDGLTPTQQNIFHQFSDWKIT